LRDKKIKGEGLYYVAKILSDGGLPEKISGLFFYPEEMNYIYIMKNEKRENLIMTVVAIIWFAAVATLAIKFG